jgi:hypothetical protein
MPNEQLDELLKEYIKKQQAADKIMFFFWKYLLMLGAELIQLIFMKF